MNESPDQREMDALPKAASIPRRRLSIQLVWIVPLVAALIGAGLLVKTWSEHRRAITISFKTGEGLTADRTKIKYKDVEIGEVRKVSIAADRSRVIVTAYMERGMESFLKEDTSFWVVRPRITGGNVTGLATLREGAYIAVDAGNSSKGRKNFVGLEVPPVVTTDEPGSRFTLRTADLGSLNIGSPVFFRRIQVGQVAAFELERGGQDVLLTVFVKAPYDRYVTAGTLFWHASGIDMRVSASGVQINTESLVSVLVGGITFESGNGDGGTPTGGFVLYPNREEAFRHARDVKTYVMTFSQSVRGLAVTAPVEFKGVAVGEVTRIGMDVSPDGRYVITVEVRIHPERFRSGGAAKGTDPDLVGKLIKRGLRARLKSGNLLTGQKYIDLDFTRSKGQKVDLTNPAHFPVVDDPSGGEMQDTLQRLAEKVEKMPLEELTAEVRDAVRGLQKAIATADRMMQHVDAQVMPELRNLLKEARDTMGEANRTLKKGSPLQADLQETMRQVGGAARSLRVLTDYLEQHPESLLRGKREKGE